MTRSNAKSYRPGKLATASGLALLVAAAGIAGFAMVSFGPTDTSAQKRELKVEWGDPEIKEFARRPVARTLSAGGEFDSRLAKLKLPVLGFERPLPSLSNSFAVAPRPRRSLIMDPNNPVWYEISYDYGDDIKVTIAADLRVQQSVKGSPSSTAPQRDFRQDSEISVFDSTSEVGMMGAIAEFQVYKFGNVPYTVTIECSAAKKAVCQDVEALKKDKELLKLISARPPQ